MGTTAINIIDYLLPEELGYVEKGKAIKLLVEWFDIKSEMEQYLHILLNENTLKQDLTTLIDSIVKNKGVYGFSVFDLRGKRLKERDPITFEQFEVEFCNDKVQALQTLFLEPVNHSKLSVVIDNLKSNALTLKELYERHMKQPEARLYSLAH